MHARSIKPPTAKAADVAKVALRNLSGVRFGKSPTFRVTPEGESRAVVATVPREAVHLFLEILEELAGGNAVAVVPVHPEITTQEAADLLSVSRPYLIGLLDSGKIPFRLVGTHRRISRADLLAFKKDDDDRRAAVLDELVADAEKHGLGY